MSGRVCIFGEVLYDHFPDGQRVLGGAPFNVAWHLQAFGQSPMLISRVGDDPQGKRVRAAMQAWGMDDTAVGVDPKRPTGKVEVTFEEGEPSYDIVPHCAYDAIQPPPAMACELLYHGSLATREAGSRRTLQGLRETNPGLIFLDVNLRPPWWERRAIEAMLEGADWVKLNQEEFELLQAGSDTGRAAMATFLARFDLAGIILTGGPNGAQLLRRSGDYSRVSPQPGIPVVDTVGAGDAFTSVVILGLLRGWSVQRLLSRAQQFASRVVGLRGATTDDPHFYSHLLNEWQVGPEKEGL